MKNGIVYKDATGWKALKSNSGHTLLAADANFFSYHHHPTPVINPAKLAKIMPLLTEEPHECPCNSTCFFIKKPNSIYFSYGVLNTKLPTLLNDSKYVNSEVTHLTPMPMGLLHCAPKHGTHIILSTAPNQDILALLVQDGRPQGFAQMPFTAWRIDATPILFSWLDIATNSNILTANSALLPDIFHHSIIQTTKKPEQLVMDGLKSLNINAFTCISVPASRL